MQYIYQQVLQRLLEHLSQAQRASLQLLVQRLIVSAGGIERVKGMRLMFVFDASRASTHALACLRAAQLSIAARSPGTFQLRIVTAWQAGMSATARANLDGSFSALFLYDDPRIELLVLDDRQPLPFDSRRLPSLDQQLAERQEWLLCGHVLDDPRATVNFASHGYLYLAELAYLASHWEGGVDAVISADTLSDRKRFLAWSRRALRQAKLLGARPLHACASTLLHGLSALRQRYLDQLHGRLQAQPHEIDPGRPALRFVTIDDLVSDRDSPGERLDGFLGFRVDDQVFASPRTGLANPMLLAHLQGLRAEFMCNSSYAEGVEDHLRQVRALMPRNGLYSALLANAPARRQRDALKQWRAEAIAFALKHYGLSDAQLVCLVFGPIVAQGRRLELFLHRCHPGMLVALPYLHKALRAEPAPEPVAQWLVDISGLPMTHLQRLYRQEAVAEGLLFGLQCRGADLRHLQVRAPNLGLARDEQPGVHG
ncbi:hypothetical protein N5D52_21545 [Pseudomonas sp. GD03860]|uniref:hypothetical protein n=1 Tax=Pseudomonas TaxID=286 RepID=UPI0023648CD5|nr:MULTISPECIES: hypothetical protein [Pseudomonas]MDD2058064.1 hypothetical protein [Pseudomonas putida]MDH0639521.1 hypothetical protein [Pseudomonas sp. GD03860]